MSTCGARAFRPARGEARACAPASHSRQRSPLAARAPARHARGRVCVCAPQGAGGRASARRGTYRVVGQREVCGVRRANRVGRAQREIWQLHLTYQWQRRAHRRRRAQRRERERTAENCEQRPAPRVRGASVHGAESAIGEFCGRADSVCLSVCVSVCLSLSLARTQGKHAHAGPHRARPCSAQSLRSSMRPRRHPWPASQSLEIPRARTRTPGRRTPPRPRTRQALPRRRPSPPPPPPPHPTPSTHTLSPFPPYPPPPPPHHPPTPPTTTPSGARRCGAPQPCGSADELTSTVDRNLRPSIGDRRSAVGGRRSARRRLRRRARCGAAPPPPPPPRPPPPPPPPPRPPPPTFPPLRPRRFRTHISPASRSPDL